MRMKLLSSIRRILVAGIVLSGLATGEALKVNIQKSRIQVDAKATGHQFTGTLSDFDVNATGDANAMTPSSFDLAWSFKDLKTGDVKRDAEMMKWLKESNPKGSFQFQKQSTEADGSLKAIGKLTIHGVSKEVICPYTVSKDGKWVSIDGVAKLDYRDFDLPIIRALAVMTVDPKLVVRFHLVGEIQ
jgi:polyisoprenoid-binding protein YceI